ncbi:MAG: hypothetical protein H6585_13480 [Flavobacteriales bacterium]|nr:hypothetical protein [Flavobacteriales bacterium]MCB9449344.1 hypothetical protein [Flavobacteriales bacterium]
MEAAHPLQQTLINSIKETLPPGQSLVDVFTDLLGISSDSAYRRIRCEKAFSIDELSLVCRHFQLSFDTLTGIQSGGVLFHNVSLDEHRMDIRMYLQNIITDLEKIRSQDDGRVIYVSKDLPLMQLFHIPEVAAFKTFFWMKTIAGFASLEHAKFRLDETDDELAKIGNRILELATKIPTIEIWSEETIVSIVGQIRYYWQMGLFADPSDAGFLCRKLIVLLEHVASEAEHGFQYPCGGNAGGVEGDYKLYINDLVLPDNTIYVHAGKREFVYLSHNVMNYLCTTNPGFCSRTKYMLDNMLKRSSQVSQVGERERSMFFRKMISRVEDLIHMVEK